MLTLSSHNSPELPRLEGYVRGILYQKARDLVGKHDQIIPEEDLGEGQSP